MPASSKGLQKKFTILISAWGAYSNFIIDAFVWKTFPPPPPPLNETGIQKSKVHSGRINYFTYRPSRLNDVVKTLLRRRNRTPFWRRQVVAMETSDDVAKTTLLQHLIKRRHNERCKDVVLATLSGISIATIWHLQSDIFATLFCLMESKYTIPILRATFQGDHFIKISFHLSL